MTTQTRQFDRIVARIDRDQLQYSRPCGASAFLDYLDEHGYIIVHPDDMTTQARPTPEQLADEYHYDSPLAFVRDHLAEHGYVIVHPDDVTEYGLGDDYEDGWNACRALIFGETAE